MAKLFIVTVPPTDLKEVYVVAESAEEAQAKVQPTLKEGELIANVEDKGDVLM